MGPWHPSPLLVSVTGNLGLWVKGVPCPDQEPKSFFFREGKTVDMDLFPFPMWDSVASPPLSPPIILTLNSQMPWILLQRASLLPTNSAAHLTLSLAQTEDSRYRKTWPGKLSLSSLLDYYSGWEQWRNIQKLSFYKNKILYFITSAIFLQFLLRVTENRPCILEYTGWLSVEPGESHPETREVFHMQVKFRRVNA